jgi:hypothetical protein
MPSIANTDKVQTLLRYALQSAIEDRCHDDVIADRIESAFISRLKRIPQLAGFTSTQLELLLLDDLRSDIRWISTKIIKDFASDVRFEFELELERADK